MDQIKDPGWNPLLLSESDKPVSVHVSDKDDDDHCTCLGFPRR